MGVEINMDATLDRLFAGFKKLSPLLVGIGVTTGLILFLPQNVLAKMALDKLPDEKKIWKSKALNAPKIQLFFCIFCHNTNKP